MEQSLMMFCIYICLVALSLIITTANEGEQLLEKSDQPASKPEDIRFCIIGLGPIGQSTANLAIDKGFKLVAAFTRYSHRTSDVADVLQRDTPLGFNVSGIKSLGPVLDETKPDVCIDATQSTIRKVYPHLTTILQHNISVITLAEQAMYPQSTKDWKTTQLLSSLKTIAQQQGVVLLASGFADGLILPSVTSIAASLPVLKRIEIRAYLKDYGDNCLQDTGVGLSLDDYNKDDGLKIKSEDRLTIWSVTIIEALSRELNMELIVKNQANARHLRQLQVFSRSECYVKEKEDGDANAAVCDGTVFTSAGFLANGMMLYMKVYVGDIDKNSMQFLFSKHKNDMAPMTVTFDNIDGVASTVASVVHRIPDVVFILEPGYYGPADANQIVKNVYFKDVDEWREPVSGNQVVPVVKTSAETQTEEESQEQKEESGDETPTESEAQLEDENTENV